jgi:hypothetical protein
MPHAFSYAPVPPPHRPSAEASIDFRTLSHTAATYTPRMEEWQRRIVGRITDEIDEYQSAAGRS